MQNNIVKYNNEFNSLKLKDFSKLDLDMLMLLCSESKEKGLSELFFDLSELKKQLKQTKMTKENFINHLIQMNHKLIQVTCEFKTKKTSLMFVLFPTFEIDLELNKLRVKVNEEFMFILNDLTKNFTSFELKEFISLKSKYAKNLYRLLKQYRRTGKYIINNEKFREIMDCPKSYKNKDFMSNCINKAIKELKDGYFENLNVKAVRDKSQKGYPIISYEFTFKKTNQIPGQKYLEFIEEEEKPKKNKKKNQFHNFQQREMSKEELNKLEKNLLKGGTIK